MDEQVAWSKKSIMNIALDSAKSISGQVELISSDIKMHSNSSIVYEYNFGTTGELIQTNALQFSMGVSSNSYTLETRYNNLLYLIIRIRYWKEDDKSETGFSPGSWDTARVYPYLGNEREGYTRNTVLNIENTYIHTLQVEFVTNDLGENNFITFLGPEIHYGQSIGEAIEDYGVTGGQLKSVDTYDDGMVAYYVDDDMPATVHVEEVVANQSYIINVSDKYSFNMVLHNGSMPWER